MKKLLFSFALLGLLYPVSSNAGIWYVNQGASGSNNGTSWADAYTSIQDAIDQAASGDTIWVAKGTYKPSSIIDGASTDPRDASFILKENVHIFGGFEGNETNFSARKSDSSSLFTTNATILSGDIGVANDGDDNAYHVVFAYDLSDFTLNGFVVEAGNGDSRSSLTVSGTEIYRHYGGGIYNYDASGNYSDMLIRDNNTTSDDEDEGGGGGMFNHGSDVTISNTTFFNNIANNCNGGAMVNESSPVTIINSFFRENIASGTDEGGGAIDNRDNSNAIISNTIFEENNTAGSGGGIYNDGSKPTLNYVIFRNNQADGSGGGMDCDGGSDAILNNVEFIDNTAGDDGGGIFCWKSSPILNHVTFTGNTAENGGGFYGYNTCNPVITNSSFVGNTALNNYGGFGLERESQAILTNVLIVKNTATNNGGGIGSHGTVTTLIITNATIANNKAVNGGGGYDKGTTTAIRNSIILGNSPDDVDINQQLVLNARYSVVGDDTTVLYIEDGSTNPMGTAVSWPFFVDTTFNNYQLDSASMAIDAGDATFFSTGQSPDLSNVLTDLRGADRIMGNGVDLGAYEFCTQTIAPDANISVSPSNTVKNGTAVAFSVAANNAGLTPKVEWYLNNTLIAGETGTTYNATAGTDFVDGDKINAIVYSTEPCASPESVTTEEIEMTVEEESGINAIVKNHLNLKLYPNPNNGDFTITGSFHSGKTYQVVITNTLGQQLYNSTVQGAQTQGKLNIASQNTLAPGFYILSVREEGGMQQAVHFSVR